MGTTTNAAGVTIAQGTLNGAKAETVVAPREIRVRVGWESEDTWRGGSLKMSRAQAYALLDTLRAALDETA